MCLRLLGFDQLTAELTGARRLSFGDSRPCAAAITDGAEMGIHVVWPVPAAGMMLRFVSRSE